MLGVSRGMSYIVSLAAVFASLLSVCSVRSAHHDIGYFVLEVIIVFKFAFVSFVVFPASLRSVHVTILFLLCFVNLFSQYRIASHRIAFASLYSVWISGIQKVWA